MDPEAVLNFFPTSLTSRWQLNSRDLSGSEEQRRQEPCEVNISDYTKSCYETNILWIVKTKTSTLWGPGNDWPNVVELEDGKNWSQLGNNHSEFVQSYDSIVGKCTHLTMRKHFDNFYPFLPCLQNSTPSHLYSYEREACSDNSFSYCQFPLHWCTLYKYCVL